MKRSAGRFSGSRWQDNSCSLLLCLWTYTFLARAPALAPFSQRFIQVCELLVRRRRGTQTLSYLHTHTHTYIHTCSDTRRRHTSTVRRRSSPSRPPSRRRSSKLLFDCSSPFFFFKFSSSLDFRGRLSLRFSKSDTFTRILEERSPGREWGENDWKGKFVNVIMYIHALLAGRCAYMHKVYNMHIPTERKRSSEITNDPRFIIRRNESSQRRPK